MVSLVIKRMNLGKKPQATSRDSGSHWTGKYRVLGTWSKSKGGKPGLRMGPLAPWTSHPIGREQLEGTQKHMGFRAEFRFSRSKGDAASTSLFALDQLGFPISPLPFQVSGLVMHRTFESRHNTLWM